MGDRNHAILAIYCVAAGFLLGFAVSQSIRVSSFCTADDVNCIREWTSALSGWAGGLIALLAAALTVRTILKQIRVSREQHDEIMKFEAYERLVLVRQVSNAARMASGTVTQIFVEFHDENFPRNTGNLKLYIEGAQHAISSLEAIEFGSMRLRAQADLPPKNMRAEIALPKFIEALRMATLVSDRAIAAGGAKSILRTASTHLMLAHEDLKSLVEELDSFLRQWSHLAA